MINPGPHWSKVNIASGNGLVPEGTKPLPNAPVPLAGDVTALAQRTKKIADTRYIRHIRPRIFINAVASPNIRSGVHVKKNHCAIPEHTLRSRCAVNAHCRRQWRWACVECTQLLREWSQLIRECTQLIREWSPHQRRISTHHCYETNAKLMLCVPYQFAQPRKPTPFVRYLYAIF